MIVGLCGYAQVGKDFAASHVKHRYRRFAFADELKKEVQEMLKLQYIDDNVLLDEEAKIRWRWLLIGWGQARRAQDKDYWIKRLIFQTAKLKMSLSDNIIITDVRFPNEVAWILRHGGTILRLTREGCGPACQEEADSIREIDELWPGLCRMVNHADDTIGQKINAWLDLIESKQ